MVQKAVQCWDTGTVSLLYSDVKRYMLIERGILGPNVPVNLSVRDQSEAFFIGVISAWAESLESQRIVSMTRWLLHPKQMLDLRRYGSLPT